MSDKDCFGLRTIPQTAWDAGHNYRDPDRHMHRFDDSVIKQFTALAKHLLGPCEVWVAVERGCEDWVWDPHLGSEVQVDPYQLFSLHATDLATRRKLLVPWAIGPRIIRHPRLKASTCLVRVYDDD